MYYQCIRYLFVLSSLIFELKLTYLYIRFQVKYIINNERMPLPLWSSCLFEFYGNLILILIRSTSLDRLKFASYRNKCGTYFYSQNLYLMNLELENSELLDLDFAKKFRESI